MRNWNRRSSTLKTKTVIQKETKMTLTAGAAGGVAAAANDCDGQL